MLESPDNPPPSAPASPLAIERLVASIDSLRRELAERDARMTSILERIEANYALLAHEQDVLRRAHLDHEVRLAALETHTFRSTKKVRKAK